MKLLIETHCLNEVENIGKMLKKIPRKLVGVDKIDILVIDDGSTDGTHIEAQKAGADFVLRNHGNKGIVYSLNRALKFAREHEYDIMVNMDADDQHDVNDLPKMIEPIVNYRADIVHGERPLKDIEYNGMFKKFFRWFGSSIVSLLVGRKIIDASSGFRALSREAIEKIHLIYDYQEPLEYLVQAKSKRLNVETVTINPKPAVRPSRLFNSLFKYITRSALIIIDNFVVYRATAVFSLFGFISLVAGASVFWWRVLQIDKYGTKELYLTSLIAAVILVLTGVQFLIFSFLARIMRANRLLNEEALGRLI
jgi:glycosyltransferase involved in cell wall biosynthesis